MPADWPLTLEAAAQTTLIKRFGILAFVFSGPCHPPSVPFKRQCRKCDRRAADQKSSPPSTGLVYLECSPSRSFLPAIPFAGTQLLVRYCFWSKRPGMEAPARSSLLRCLVCNHRGQDCRMCRSYSACGHPGRRNSRSPKQHQHSLPRT